MKRDYRNWHHLKSKIQANESEVFFHRREIWFCSIGLNVGYEQDGKHAAYERPILIVKQFNRDVFLALPLTSSKKQSPYSIPYQFRGKTYSAIISQVRLLDWKRLRRKVGLMSPEQFDEIFLSLRTMLQ